MGVSRGRRAVAIATGGLLLAVAAGPARAAGDGVFQDANAKARAGDYPKALEGYRAAAASGGESASLYWNWAQAAAARGASGEALWALLRAREIEPADQAVAREIERVRQAVNLDAAEITPDPLATAARLSRHYRVDLLAAALFLGSLVLHAAARLSAASSSAAGAAAIVFVLGLLAAAAPVAGSMARPTAVVVRRGAPLLDAASPTAEAAGSLREGEVVPVLAESGGYVRIEDSSGARGWASGDDVRRLDHAPAPAAR
jgi:hypothetical protein